MLCVSAPREQAGLSFRSLYVCCGGLVRSYSFNLPHSFLLSTDLYLYKNQDCSLSCWVFASVWLNHHQHGEPTLFMSPKLVFGGMYFYLYLYLYLYFEQDLYLYKSQGFLPVCVCVTQSSSQTESPHYSCLPNWYLNSDSIEKTDWVAFCLTNIKIPKTFIWLI